jgi:phosphate/sulfate permease
MAIDFKSFAWTLQLSITALIFYSPLIGGAIVAILTLPKLASKSLHERRMNNEIRKLKEKMLTLEKCRCWRARD